MTNRKEFFLIIFFSLFYFISHLTNITKIPIYLDESIYLFWAKIFQGNEGLAYVSLQDGKTPLFMWIASYVLKMFQDPLLAGRVISVISGFGTMINLYLITRIIINKKTALFFLLFYTILPFGFITERLAFVDALLMFFSTLSLLLLFLSLNTKYKILNTILAILSGLSLGLAFYTKTSARLFFIAFLISSLPFYLSNLSNVRNLVKKTLSLIIFIFVYLQSIDILRTGASRFWSMVGEKEQELTYSIPEIIKNPFNLTYINHGKLLLEHLFYYITPIILIFVIIGIFASLTKKFRAGIPIIVITIISLVGLLLSAKIFASRYTFLAYPFIVVIAAIGASFLFEKTSKKLFSILFLISLILPIVISSLILFAPKYAFMAEDDRNFLICKGLSGYGIKETVDYLNPLLKNGKVSLFVDSWWGIPESFRLYFGDNKNLLLKKYGYALNINGDMQSDANSHPTFLFLGVNRLKDTRVNTAKNIETVFFNPRPFCNSDFSIPVHLLKILPKEK